MLHLFTSLLALLAIALPPMHPHVPKAIVLQGAGGKTTLTYFTVPYNPEQVKTLPNGAEWHLGYANLEVGMPMELVIETLSESQGANGPERQLSWKWKPAR